MTHMYKKPVYLCLTIAPVKTPVILISATSRIFTFLITWIRTRMYTGWIFCFTTVSPEAVRTSMKPRYPRQRHSNRHARKKKQEKTRNAQELVFCVDKK